MPPLWPWRRSLATIGLELPRQEDGAVAGPVGRELMAVAIVEGVAAAAARQPLLIVLEDLHWSDPVSVLVARAAAEAAAALPLMLLLTCRDEQDEATQQVRDRLAELPASVLRMLLPPLDGTAVAALAGSIAGPGLADQVAAGLLARTGGNPFFVHEVARLIAARGPAAALTVPPGVREVLQRRLARITQPCVSLLTAAAIVAETAAEAIEDDLLCQVSGVSGEAASRLLDEAATGRLLDVGPAGPARYRFRHALVREVLDQGLSAARRGELHAAAGEALEQRASPPTAAARACLPLVPRGGPPSPREGCCLVAAGGPGRGRRLRLRGRGGALCPRAGRPVGRGDRGVGRVRRGAAAVRRRRRGQGGAAGRGPRGGISWAGQRPGQGRARPRRRPGRLRGPAAGRRAGRFAAEG